MCTKIYTRHHPCHCNFPIGTLIPCRTFLATKRCPRSRAKWSGVYTTEPCTKHPVREEGGGSSPSESEKEESQVPSMADDDEDGGDAPRDIHRSESPGPSPGPRIGVGVGPGIEADSTYDSDESVNISSAGDEHGGENEDEHSEREGASDNGEQPGGSIEGSHSRHSSMTFLDYFYENAPGVRRSEGE